MLIFSSAQDSGTPTVTYGPAGGLNKKKRAALHFYQSPLSLLVMLLGG